MKKKYEKRIAMTGATGFVGTHLRETFHGNTWEIIVLGRSLFSLTPKELAQKLEGSDVIINLAGAPIIEKWTEDYKKKIYESRVGITKSLVDACALMEKKPELFISTSAIGYYAPGNYMHTEDDYEKADNFLGDLAEAWEGEARKAHDLGIRTAIFRFGVVLGKNGGALKQMLTPFKMGMGGTIGDGSQAFSWVHIRDLAQVFANAIEDKTWEGIYNLTSPNPTTNRGLTEALGHELGRPTLMRVPHFVLRMQFGEGAQVLTEGQNVMPKRLLESGFTFQFEHIEEAVKDCLS